MAVPTIVASAVVSLFVGCGTPPDFSALIRGSAGGGPAVDAGDVPPIDYCAPATIWLEDSIRFEQRVLTLVNQRRAAGADCGARGVFVPAGPLTMNEALRCAARRHSLDMEQRGFFDHDNPDGEAPDDRIERAGYVWSAWGENIAAGQPTPEIVMQDWMASDGHCANIMNPGFTEIGVGHYVGSKWTQEFGRPR
jgi:uncharacterized protein YkwD